jgi:vacuolar-type H+-ATPase subunit E/Vma4
VGYAELGLALAEEAHRQVAELDGDAERAAADLIEAARRAAAGERGAALAAEGRAAAEDERRHSARLSLELERALLVEARAILAELEEASAARLETALDAALAARLARELLPELEGPGWKVSVDAATVDEVRRALGEGIEVVAGPSGGVIAERGGRTLDNSPRARLARALPDLEAELAQLLFEGAA